MHTRSHRLFSTGFRGAAAGALTAVLSLSVTGCSDGGGGLPGSPSAERAAGGRTADAGPGLGRSHAFYAVYHPSYGNYYFDLLEWRADLRAQVTGTWTRVVVSADPGEATMTRRESEPITARQDGDRVTLTINGEPVPGEIHGETLTLEIDLAAQSEEYRAIDPAAFDKLVADAEADVMRRRAAATPSAR